MLESSRPASLTDAATLGLALVIAVARADRQQTA
jgi:hypothetical protein